MPLVVIFGHSSRKQLAKGMLQEVPYLDTFQTMAKWTFSVPSPERIPEVFRRAFTLARSGRPGPVIIEVPQDISMAQAEMPPYQPTRRVRFGPDPDDIDKLIELLQGAKRPLIYVGRGALWSRATEQLVKVAETLRASRDGDACPRKARCRRIILCASVSAVTRARFTAPGNHASLPKRPIWCSLSVAVSASTRLRAGCPNRQTSNLSKSISIRRSCTKTTPADLVILSDIQLFLRALLQHAPAKA